MASSYEQPAIRDKGVAGAKKILGNIHAGNSACGRIPNAGRILVGVVRVVTIDEHFACREQVLVDAFHTDIHQGTPLPDNRRIGTVLSSGVFSKYSASKNQQDRQKRQKAEEVPKTTPAHLFPPRVLALGRVRTCTASVSK